MTTLSKFLNRNRILIIIILLFSSTSLLNNKQLEKSLLIETTLEKEIHKIEENLFTLLPTTHSATWYSLPGNRTYSGEWFYKDSLTAAYNFRSMGTILKVTNLHNNKSVIVRVNDKMGNKSKNIIDLSHGAFKKIAEPRRGKIKVQIEELKKN